MVILNNKKYTVSVIISCYNEERLIEKTLEGIPKFVDNIIVIDDGSTDNGFNVINNYKKRKLIILRHKINMGVGSSLIDGYKMAIKLNSNITVTIDGDNQMDPNDMLNIITPISQGFDYVKGNRLNYKGVFTIMPKIRFFGNWFLTLITKFASGYWHINDSQCGYTAINLKTLKKMDLDNCYKRYGFLNDLLSKLNIINVRVKNVQVKPVYGEELSKIRYLKYIKDLSYVIIKSFISRLWKKYIIIKY